MCIIFYGRRAMWFDGKQSIYVEKNSRLIVGVSDFKEHIKHLGNVPNAKKLYALIKSEKGNWVSF